VASNKRKIEDLIEMERELKRVKEVKIELKTLPNTWGIDMPITSEKKRHYWVWSEGHDKGKTSFTRFIKKTGFGQEVDVDSKYHDLEDDKDILILDEYNDAKLKVSEINRMCDGTRIYDRKYKKPIIFEKPLIIVTSNKNIETVYPNKHELVQARFNEINVD